MEFFRKLKEKSGLSGVLSVFVIIVLAIIITVTAVLVTKNKEPEAVIYDYNATEQQIADEVKAYLLLYFALPDETAAQIADEAVQNYNIIIASDVDIVSDDHTEAIKQRIRIAMLSLLDEETAAALTDDDLDALSSGITSIIWNILLSQLETTTDDYKEEYLYLSESIQNQINELEERKMKVSIQANIKKNPDVVDMDAESLLAVVNNMTDEELEELAKSLGLSLEELNTLLLSANEKTKEGIEKDLEKELAELKKELTKEITNQLNSATQTGGQSVNSTVGRAGTNGRDGTNGKDGADGKDGQNGATTYIAYADDASGAGFSFTPTETSKYVGTCVTSESSQPTNPAVYGNWQLYRMYVITTTTDENGVTTMHIN